MSEGEIAGLQNEAARQDHRIGGLEARVSALEANVAGIRSDVTESHRRIDGLSESIKANTAATTEGALLIKGLVTRREVEDEQRAEAAKRNGHRVAVIALLVSILSVGVTIGVKVFGW